MNEETQQQPVTETKEAPIKVQLFTEIHEGLKVALCVPSAPTISINPAVYKIQRIRPNGTLVLKKLRSLEE